MEEIRQAVAHAVVAGRLRAAIAEHGSGLRGLERLADRHSALAGEWLDQIGGEHQVACSPPSAERR